MDWITPVKPGFGGFDFPYEKADVVFIGVPLDVTSSYRSGYRFAPTKIREASANLETYIPTAGIDVFVKHNISDLGDIILTPTDIVGSGRRITEVVRKVVRDGKIPILLGGEHTLTYFSVKAFPDVFVIQLDAHADLRDEYLGDRICHATVMRRILESIPEEKIAQLGIRSCSAEEAEFLKKSRHLLISTETLLEKRSEAMEQLKKTIGSSPVYLTVDLDVLDPAFAPGVATPEPGGLHTVDLLRITREIAGLNLVGCDIVELTPPHDNGSTAFAAARIAYEILAFMK
ncbi:MAG: agmatinase [Candidatus Hadarchaeales archaeon]